MPNNGRITVCPFYLSERNKTISCEDTPHRFRYRKQKKDWMGRYCDHDWAACPYAKDLNDMYDKLFKEGDTEVETEHKIDALEKEIRKLSQMLTKAEKRLEAKDEEIKAIRKKKQSFEQKAVELNSKYMELKKGYDYLERKLLNTSSMYKARFCYLIHVAGDGTFNEAEFWQWAKNKEYRLVGMDPDEKGRPTWWKAEVKGAEPENVLSDKR